jgi:hypothetical protein
MRLDHFGGRRDEIDEIDEIRGADAVGATTAY